MVCRNFEKRFFHYYLRFMSQKYKQDNDSSLVMKGPTLGGGGVSFITKT